MTANTRFPCAINPETGKPFTKHKHVDQLVKFCYHGVGVRGNIFLGGWPEPKVQVTKRCIRPGCKKNIWVQP